MADIEIPQYENFPIQKKSDCDPSPVEDTNYYTNTGSNDETKTCVEDQNKESEDECTSSVHNQDPQRHRVKREVSRMDSSGIYNLAQTPNDDCAEVMSSTSKESVNKKKEGERSVCSFQKYIPSPATCGAFLVGFLAAIILGAALHPYLLPTHDGKLTDYLNT